MTSDGRRQGWSDLPDDLLDEVYRRCVLSLFDRARFASVCESWRAVATQRHPAIRALPLLLPSTGNGKRDRTVGAYRLEDGRVVRASFQGFPWGKRIVGSHDGGWIAAATGAQLFIVNLFSGARVELSAKQRIIRCKCLTKRPRSRHATGQISITKIVFSKEPCSTGCIIAGITTGCKIALCRVDCPNGGWTTSGCETNTELMDITFCNGKLYALTSKELLEFRMNENGALVVNLVDRIRRGMSVLGIWKLLEKYIFELHGKLAMAVGFSPMIYSRGAQFFRVFELTPAMREVTSLGDHALFLGPGCCKAVHVPVTGGQGMVERNCIYYLKQHICPKDDVECLKRLDLGSYNIYYGKSKGVDHSEKIRSWVYHHPHEDGNNGCIWVLPPDF
ncbi:probable F-box protein At4g22165 [Aegilops tauschii subsp. strangulata]|uniref:probable F-box protein At4g22165 n=1 Tax=Aegilops tauschii subsp. strangulata TaxID=200361 RepID=UPI00098A50AC